MKSGVYLQTLCVVKSYFTEHMAVSGKLHRTNHIGHTWFKARYMRNGRDFKVKVKFVSSTLVTLLATITFFVLNTIADSESASDKHTEFLIFCLVIVFIVVGMVCFARSSTRKERAFLKEHRSQLSSEDPKVLLELSEKCDEYLKDQYNAEVIHLSQQAKSKTTRIRKKIDFQANLETFKSEISEDESHPSVVSTLKKHMHNPDSFQHVSSNYETMEKEGKSYYKIVMVFRGTNTFGALVLQTCFFILDEDNQISLVGSPNDTESSTVNTEKLSASIDAASSLFEGIASAADVLSFFSSE